MALLSPASLAAIDNFATISYRRGALFTAIEPWRSVSSSRGNKAASLKQHSRRDSLANKRSVTYQLSWHGTGGRAKRNSMVCEEGIALSSAKARHHIK